MEGGRVALLSFLLLFCSFQFGFGLKQRVYQFSQPVPVLVNHVGPYKNPSETYDYYDLPFCKPPPHIQHRFFFVFFFVCSFFCAFLCVFFLFFSCLFSSEHWFRHASLGEKLEGDHYERSLYDVRFQGE